MADAKTENAPPVEGSASAAAAAAAAATPPPKVVDEEYYQLLGVPTNATDADLKKAYRRQAIKYHPDKNPSPDAEEMFKKIAKAYQVLSDPALRDKYNKYGKTMVENVQGTDDPSAFFASVFGGEAFHDLIGEISLMKEMTSAAEVIMTDEEKAAMEQEQLAAVQAKTGTPSTPALEASGAPSASTSTTPGSPPLGPHKNGKAPTPVDKKGRAKLTDEQRHKLKTLDDERKKTMTTRVEMLALKLKERMELFVTAKNPGEKGDPNTQAFEEKMKKYAEELRWESFGVELLHVIGTIYMLKATSFLKSRRFLGIPGVFARLKEKSAMVKDVWGIVGSAMDVQNIMEDMARKQERGEIQESDLRAMEMDLTGKILLASWRGTRFEVGQVLREVCDLVLKEPGIPEQVLVNRAKALLFMGGIFKATKPDESPEERRELERLVAEAAASKAKPKKKTKA
jgi:curved DNA-binding protein CbpA